MQASKHSFPRPGALKFFSHLLSGSRLRRAEKFILINNFPGCAAGATCV
jgi:hypothetical protein